ncbi:hypothetical protein G5I_04241 [Acromyrmex echinatior]|uniref:Uncharacterized protein n=1 Tax=Acromyrmex echinatior TaxID=103372 RepID=F4WF35_ACREC|nr:hypothetical protein G5I_04241 [Acromyrmex echinatior]
MRHAELRKNDEEMSGGNASDRKDMVLNLQANDDSRRRVRTSIVCRESQVDMYVTLALFLLQRSRKVGALSFDALAKLFFPFLCALVRFFPFFQRSFCSPHQRDKQSASSDSAFYTLQRKKTRVPLYDPEEFTVCSGQITEIGGTISPNWPPFDAGQAVFTGRRNLTYSSETLSSQRNRPWRGEEVESSVKLSNIIYLKRRTADCCAAWMATNGILLYAMKKPLNDERTPDRIRNRLIGQKNAGDNESHYLMITLDLGLEMLKRVFQIQVFKEFNNLIIRKTRTRSTINEYNSQTSNRVTFAKDLRSL